MPTNIILSSSFFTSGLNAMGHFCHIWMTGQASSCRWILCSPGKHPIPSKEFGYSEISYWMFVILSLWGVQGFNGAGLDCCMWLVMILSTYSWDIIWLMKNKSVHMYKSLATNKGFIIALRGHAPGMHMVYVSHSNIVFVVLCIFYAYLKISSQ